jgi:nitrogen fixation protein FixH
MTMSAKEKPERRGVRGAHVLWGMLAFFAVIIAADSTMIYKALSTFGGVDDANAYRDGVEYNMRIARDAEQSRLGWQDDVETLGSPQRLRVTLRDSRGEAVSGKKLVARIGRPATTRFDETLDLTEVASGLYEIPLTAAREGSWIVDLSAFEPRTGSNVPVYQMRRRVWIKP